MAAGAPMEAAAEDDGLLAAQTEEFVARGFCVVPAALSAAELASMREAFDADRRAVPHEWQLRGQSRDGGEVGEKGRWQTEPLCRTTAFDSCIWHPKTFPLLQAVMGRETMRLHHMSAMSRDPVEEEPAPEMHGYHVQMYHREQGGAFSPDHPYCCQTMMVLYYLDDCTADSHCFSVVPESLEAKKALPWRMTDGESAHAQIDEPFIERMWRNRPGSMMSDEIQDGVGRPDGLDIIGKAGTAIVTNACNIHAGTVRQSSRPRRSIILWWTHGPQAYPPLTERRPDDPAIRGVNRALPPRLLEHPEWSWLFSQAPLTEEERWVTLGRGAPPAAARL